jgi:hypothetical protein
MNLWSANSAFCRQKTPSAAHRKSSLENMAKSHQIARRTSSKSPDFESRLKHVAKIEQGSKKILLSSLTYSQVKTLNAIQSSDSNDFRNTLHNTPWNLIVLI